MITELTDAGIDAHALVSLETTRGIVADVEVTSETVPTGSPDGLLTQKASCCANVMEAIQRTASEARRREGRSFIDAVGD